MACNIEIASDLTDKIKALAFGKDAFVVTDSNVAALYGGLFPKNRTFVVPAGEDSKTLAWFEKISRAMLDAGCGRGVTVVAVGGGVVGDLAGFVAATYMRGVDWASVPTTLLSQVDSGVGGKTAVDLGDYKNMIGAFHMPTKVLISTHFLATLPDREWLCGTGEIVKTAFLSRKVHDILGGDVKALLARDDKLTRRLVEACVEYKRAVTEADFRESGPRKALNLGHTVGHAIEKVDGHRLSHGEYVLIGLDAEAHVLKSRMDAEVYAELTAAVKACAPAVPDFDPEAVVAACMHDKKNTDAGTVSVMLADYENTREVKLTREELLGGLVSWRSLR